MTGKVNRPGASTTARRRLQGIGLMAAAIMCFSVLDATAKYLTVTTPLPVAEIVWLRFAWHVLFATILLGPLNVPHLLRSNRTGLQWIRSVFMIGATYFNFLALKYLQLDQTVTIFFLTPLIVAALAGPLLGEWVGWRRMLAICIGFFGIILVTRPGFGGIHWAVSFAFIATLSYALYNIATRYLAAHDTTQVTLFYSPLAGFLLTAPIAFSEWVWPADLTTWALLASLGLTGGLGHWLLILAHARAPAPILAPFVYVGILSMSLLGFLIFGHIPTAWTLAGGAVVIASGLYLLYRERQNGPQQDS